MKKINAFYRNYYRILTKYIYGKKFRFVGKKACVFDPLQIDNPDGISIEENVMIAHKGWLMGTRESSDPGLVIKARTQIGHFSHIIALHSVFIGEDVLIADKVFISDSTHTYKGIELPIIYQPIVKLHPVIIGNGSWIGENVCIIGASIGKHCVVAANSVVNKDFPDYTVIAGSPAKAIMHYDFDKNEWTKVLNKVCS